MVQLFPVHPPPIMCNYAVTCHIITYHAWYFKCQQQGNLSDFYLPNLEQANDKEDGVNESEVNNVADTVELCFSAENNPEKRKFYVGVFIITRIH